MQITRDDSLKLLGLFKLATDHYAKLREAEFAINREDAIVLDQIRYATETGVGVAMPLDLAASEPTLERYRARGWIKVTPSDDNGRGGLGWITKAGRKALAAFK